jgi:predicted O-methyltransferase YrrM
MTENILGPLSGRVPGIWRIRKDMIQSGILIFIGAIVTVLGLIAVYTFYKVRNVHLMLFAMARKLEMLESHQKRNAPRLMDSMFRQIESLVSLYLDLNLHRSLPATREWAASPDFLRELVSHALNTRPEVIVECGSGVSTIVLARCLELNETGHLYSLEHSQKFGEQTRKALEKHGLSRWATVIDSPIKPVEIGGVAWNWYSLEQLPQGQIDMLIVDGPPGDMGKWVRYPAGPMLFPRLAAGATVFADDLIRDDERAIFDRWLHESPAFVAEIKPSEKGCGILKKKCHN